MACYVPFNNRNLDISFFVFRPTVVHVEDLVNALKKISVYIASLGCVHSSVFRSIHGNTIVWYGAWIKRTDENMEILNTTLLSMLTNTKSMAILIDYSFFGAYGGESKDGSPAAKFFTGDIISMNTTDISPNENSDIQSISSTCTSLFKEQFAKMNGAKAGIFFRSQTMTRNVGLYVWKSLQFFYSHLLTSDYREKCLPHLEGFTFDVKYDVFRVVCVSGESVVNVQKCPQYQVMGNEMEKKNEAYSV